MDEYRVLMYESSEGISVSCPSLRGCHSQGATREEALDNIKDAIREWIDAESDERDAFKVIKDTVEV